MNYDVFAQMHRENSRLRLLWTLARLKLIEDKWLQHDLYDLTDLGRR